MTDNEKREKLNKFLNELTELCRKHNLYVVNQCSQDAWVENEQLETVANEFWYDMEAQSYDATLVKRDKENV